MPISANAWVQTNPSFVEPGLIMPVAQVSGAFSLIAGGAPRPRLSQGDLWVYMKQIDIRTQMAMGQSGYNQLPGVAITMNQIQAPTYNLRVAAIYDQQDEAAAGRWGISLPQAYRLGMRQGHFQLARNLLLYGAYPANGEGLVNGAGVSAVDLPPDSNLQDTVVTYDNGEMAFFILQQIELIKTRTNQLGIGRKFTICGPQRVLGAFQYQNVVQLTQFQRTGAGSETTAGLVEDILKRNKDILEWTYDDTLQGKGSGGTDLVIITMPEIEQQSTGGINTNEFANLQPNNNTCMTMYCDMAAPMEITSPGSLGSTQVMSQWRVSSGWSIRPEAQVNISMAFE